MVSKELEQKIAEFQSLQAQVNMLAAQKQQVQKQLDEIQDAEEELKKCSGRVFKSAGTLLIQTEKPQAEKTLGERKEMASVRLGALNKQEERIKPKITELRAFLEQAAAAAGAG